MEKTFYVLYNKSKIKGEPKYKIGTVQAKTKLEARNKARNIFPTTNAVMGEKGMRSLKQLELGAIHSRFTSLIPLYVYEAIQEFEM